MIEWLKQVFHPHRWKILSEGNLTYEGVLCGTFYNLQCQTCGKVKRRNLCAS